MPIIDGMNDDYIEYFPLEEYINKIKGLKVISYLSNDNFKRKIKKILYKIKYEVLKWK